MGSARAANSVPSRGREGRVLHPANLKAAFTPVKTRVNQDSYNSKGTGYGFSWFMRCSRGLREILHGGDLDGFRSMLLRKPDEKLTVAILANAEPGKPDASPQRLAYALMAIFLAEKLAPLPAVNTKVSPKSYDALTGRYGFVPGQVWGLDGGIIPISRRGTHLFGSGTV